MAMIWQREVDNYKSDVFRASTLNYTRAIRLELKASGGNAVHTVSIEFHSSPPADNISIGTNFSTIKLPLSDYDDMYHMLQTEKPLFFTAYEQSTLRFAGLTTDEEGTGEGFKDPNAL